MSNYVIIGANSEIGEALTSHLTRKGHALLLVSRSLKCGQYSKMHQWIDGIDLLNESQLLILREEVSKRFVAPFTVIHSIGDFWKHKSIDKTQFNEAISMIQSHYITLFGVIKAIVPVMRKVGGGKIIAFSCNSVKYNYPDMVAFTSAKAAVECLIKCVANEQSKYNITANAFALPSIKTKRVIATKPNEFHKDYTTLDELSNCIEQTLENLSCLVNGDIINLFKYSNSFYGKGYYERNNISEDISDAAKTNGIL
jgi:3-oxoacyl-[acyl-carrier protein] reductase